MVRKRRPRSPQTHPTGPLETVDDDWKRDVRAAMDRLKWDQQTLADRAGVSTGAISNMFKPGPRQLRFKARVEEVLGITDVRAKLAKVLERIERKFNGLTLDNAEIVAQLVENLTKTTQSGDH
jgi:ribosome-binding protein aMBF1 (putative translation factor)